MSNEVEFTLDGLNPKQKALCDIMWGFEEFTWLPCPSVNGSNAKD